VIVGNRASSNVSVYPWIEVNGVRSSWETLAIKSRRVFSSVRHREIAQHGDRPAAGHRRRGHVERAPTAIVFDRAELRPCSRAAF